MVSIEIFWETAHIQQNNRMTHYLCGIEIFYVVRTNERKELKWKKKLTKCNTVFTTSRFVTWPTSISPIRTANLRLSVIDIRTTSSGRLISLYGGRVRSAIFTVWVFDTSFVHEIFFRIFFQSFFLMFSNLKYHTHAHTHANCVHWLVSVKFDVFF